METPAGLQFCAALTGMQLNYMRAVLSHIAAPRYSTALATMTFTTRLMMRASPCLTPISGG